MQNGLSAKDIKIILKRLNKIEDSIKAIKEFLEDQIYPQMSMQTTEQVLQVITKPKTRVICGGTFDREKKVQQSKHLKRKSNNSRRYAKRELL